MNLFDVILARKIEAKHGGGSGDFSIAKMTVTGGNDINDTFTTIYEEGGIAGIMTENMTYFTGETYNIPLYKGLYGQSVSDHVNVTGNATYDSENRFLTVTGDFTIEFVGG